MNVFITGASGGLGRALAAECAKRGYNLYLTDINGRVLEAFAEGIKRLYPVSVYTYACDLKSEAEVNAMAKNLSGTEIDMLMNVAGIDFEGGFKTRNINDILSIVQVNVEAVLRITYEILKLRNAGKNFKILFVSSLASMFPIPLKATYAATKRFLLDFATSLRQELKYENVSILTLCPGGLATNPSALEGIVAQGFWGSATANRPEVVACKAIDKLIRGKALYIPGVINKLLCGISKLFPRNYIARILYNRWYKAQKKQIAKQNA
jgi:short-subunit dehydrogenase